MASGVLSCDGQPQQLLHQTPYGPCEMPDVIHNVQDTFHQQTSAFPNQFFFSKPAALPSQCSWCPDVKHGQVHLLSDSRSPFQDTDYSCFARSGWNQNCSFITWVFFVQYCIVTGHWTLDIGHTIKIINCYYHLVQHNAAWQQIQKLPESETKFTVNSKKS